MAWREIKKSKRFHIKVMKVTDALTVNLTNNMNDCQPD